ncbi:MAG: SPOR domain-containing protein [Candidatus Omnitrophica bacterium]|nr:SPOR domain-containing protein [Candidatus Omnitrophota bacterium]MDD5573968.1 SPOR domain-containing protein [Candidatus Omnitrophota bacterium]
MRKRRNILSVLAFGALLLVAAPACASAPAADALDKAQILFLQKQYVQAIDECVRVIKEHPDNPEIVSEANYLTGASYVNLFDFLTAKKNFRAIVEQYKGAPFYEDAYMGLGDIEFLQENYSEALKVYEEFLRTGPSKKRRATLYFRLAEIYLKNGDQEAYKKYFDLLQKEYPLSFEARDARRLKEHEAYFTVQVGAFTNFDNARQFIDRLKAKGYNAYSVLCMLSGKKLCRIRIGRYRTEEEAQQAARQLEKDGFFAKVFPME